MKKEICKHCGGLGGDTIDGEGVWLDCESCKNINASKKQEYYDYCVKSTNTMLGWLFEFIITWVIIFALLLVFVYLDLSQFSTK